jgi:hypothetical protein
MQVQGVDQQMQQRCQALNYNKKYSAEWIPK